MGLLLLIGASLLLVAMGEPKPRFLERKPEQIFEPPEEEGARYQIRLFFGKQQVTWQVWRWNATTGLPSGAKPMAIGGALDRETALEQAYEAIDEDRGKLPEPIVRHGLRMSADCQAIKVQNLEAWIEWATEQIDAFEPNDKAGPLMRMVFAAAFPECPTSTPTIRGKPWSEVAKSVQRLLDKHRAGKFIAVAPVNEVLAARLVSMSVPKRPGAAFFYRGAGSGQNYAVVIDQPSARRGPRGLPKNAVPAFEWRAWLGKRGSEDAPHLQGNEPTIALAKVEAKAEIDKEPPRPPIPEPLPLPGVME